MQATRLTLICHARTVAQKLARFPTDEPVEMDGFSARGSRGERFNKAFRLLCGPELRTRQTAEFFASEMEIVASLRDCDIGRWAGMCIDDVHASEPAALQAWLNEPDQAPHGGESLAQLRQRVAAWLATLESTPEHIVAITHPFVIRAALMHVLNGAAFTAIDVEPLSAIELRFNGQWRLRLTNADREEPC